MPIIIEAQGLDKKILRRNCKNWNPAETCFLHLRDIRKCSLWVLAWFACQSISNRSETNFPLGTRITFAFDQLFRNVDHWILIGFYCCCCCLPTNKLELISLVPKTLVSIQQSGNKFDEVIWSYGWVMVIEMKMKIGFLVKNGRARLKAQGSLVSRLSVDITLLNWKSLF